ncbi:methyltransferase domain-containing protein [Hyphomicrobium sp. LHD-15]|uniref:methyltransferase domain-containing protein n=1 Tax=Hyphomicrobium sp. LHD-15 TaxID=3072142 RepID=UPI00280DC23E|nr:methyltransferase domain-containing protein [Hyphomicrobium sp. LHD-15]MDQ8698594.1 methyltransferase domain-containing protein [Hyphomicrobium sp. LHD-15]
MKDRAEDQTRRLLLDAGLQEGMRVLDIGCGRGDVSILAAQLVGMRGQVVGIDREQAPLEAGRARVSNLGLANVSFERADLSSLPTELGAFDAVIGRRVLMYQPDAVAALMHVTDVLKPGGLIVLQEHDSTSMPICAPEMPLHERVSRWIWDTVEREGADIHMGLHLAPALVRAGFEVEHVRAEATILTPDQSHPIAAIVRAMLGRIGAADVATAEEIDVETLDARLSAERHETNRTCIWEMVFGAWARKPG